MSKPTIRRIDAGSRLSVAVVYKDRVYLSGLVAFKNRGGPIRIQVKEVLDEIDRYLREAGSNRDCLLRVQIWLADMNDFSAMNEVWETWITPGLVPARATVGAVLADADLKIEIAAEAALAAQLSDDE